MKIIITGGTGFIGSAVLDRLLARDHDVIALVRSDRAAAAVAGRGATAVIGDLTDPDWLAGHLAHGDGAIHAAAAGDGTDADLDAGVVKAVGHAFGGTGRPYLHTGGIWLYGANRHITEQSPVDPPAIVAWRVPVEQSLLGADVAATVVVPGIVYGDGRGIPALVAGGPRTEDGALTLIGDGRQHWVTVHVDDLAELYVQLLEQGSGFGHVVAAAPGNPTVRELAAAVAGPAGVAAQDVAGTRARLGASFADALLIDQGADAARARALGWAPRRPSLLDEFTRGSYAG